MTSLIRVFAIRGENDGRLARKAPDLLGIEWHDAAAAVAWRFARPQEPPAMTLDRRQQRFGCRVKRKIAPEIDDQQPVGAALVEEAQHPGFIRQHRAVDPDRALPENRLLAAHRQQVTMESVDGGISLPFALIEHRSAEGADVAGVGEQLLHLLAREAGKLCKKGSPPVADGACQLALVVGEIEERARSTEFLALEQHRNPR